MPSKDVYTRLFERDTVNSLVRRNCSKRMCQDSLDLVLSSVYNHEKDLFVSKFDTLLQLENAKYNPIKEKLYMEKLAAQRNDIHHPLVMGGITERKSPHSIKLICCGQHTPTTNPGYSRQPLDGNIFKY
ncbi:uncharacterized protein LOC116343666 [Contarinia nasturtii]|uniref:uncharacterized protein LOC116343666 n=1 Tax=Contarinia nasturtii TaxID=265458 RepID=UPI0012D3C3B2|nr:uncharacterized protein LOC116343666 [Contarinia nasturtii]